MDYDEGDPTVKDADAFKAMDVFDEILDDSNHLADMSPAVSPRIPTMIDPLERKKDRIPTRSETSRDSRGEPLADIYFLLKELLPKLHEQIERIHKHTSSHVGMCIQTAYPVMEHLCMAIAMDPDFVAVKTNYSRNTTPLGDDLQLTGRSQRRTRTGNESENELIYDTLCSYAIQDDDAGKNSARSSASSTIKPKRLSLSPEPSNVVDYTLELRSIHSKGEFVTSGNRCYIHPEKPFRLSWDAISLFLILIVSIMVPIELSFYWDEQAPGTFQGISYVIDTYFGIDIVLNFVTAHHMGHGISGQLVTDFRGIAIHYLRGWFIIDVLATTPYMEVVGLFGRGESEGSAGAESLSMLKMLKYAKIARVMKVLRVLKLGGLMQIVEEKMVAAQSMTVAFQLFKMTIVMFILSHNVACIWYASATQIKEKKSWLIAQGLDGASGVSQYVAAFYFAITTGTTVGYGDIHPVNEYEQAITAFLLIASVGFIGQFLGRVSQMVNSLRQRENDMASSKREALLYMSQRYVPKDLQYKVLRYIEHIFQSHSITSLDANVMENLSESLQSELALIVVGNVYRQFPLFEDATDEFLTSLCAVGQTKRAGIGDIVCMEEQVANEMFWVVKGEATVFRRGQLINILRSDDWFGELALFFPGAVRTATVRCETHCEFLVLDHASFHKQMRKFPQVYREYVKLFKELKQGDPSGLKLRCVSCGSKDHLSRDCPLGPPEVPLEYINKTEPSPVSSRRPSLSSRDRGGEQKSSPGV